MEKKVEITSSQNVVIEYTLATAVDRGFALLIDLVIMSIAFLVLSWAFTLMGQQNTVYMLLALLPFMFYSLLWECLNEGQSPGKKVLNLKVVKLDGSEPHLSDYGMRWAFRLLDLYFSATSLGLLLISTTNKAQRTGDIASNMCVIRHTTRLKKSLSEILAIKTLENYTPFYENAHWLSHPEILFVKQCLDRYKKYPNDSHAEVLSELSSTIKSKLKITTQRPPADFLQTIIRDYVVLTR